MNWIPQIVHQIVPFLCKKTTQAAEVALGTCLTTKPQHILQQHMNLGYFQAISYTLAVHWPWDSKFINKHDGHGHSSQLRMSPYLFHDFNMWFQHVVTFSWTKDATVYNELATFHCVLHTISPWRYNQLFMYGLNSTKWSKMKAVVSFKLSEFHPVPTGITLPARWLSFSQLIMWTWLSGSYMLNFSD